jgi:hypothetical protein
VLLNEFTDVAVELTFVTHVAANADCEPAAMKTALSATALMDESSTWRDAEKVGFRPEITVRINATPTKRPDALTAPPTAICSVTCVVGEWRRSEPTYCLNREIPGPNPTRN